MKRLEERSSKSLETASSIAQRWVHSTNVCRVGPFFLAHLRTANLLATLRYNYYLFVLLVPIMTIRDCALIHTPRGPKVPKRDTVEIDALLPLKPTLYLILLALTDGDRHGYGLKKEILRRTDGKVKLGAGSLYRSIRKLVDMNLIEESDQRPDPALDDERRTYFRLTKLGRRVAKAETDRLAVLVQVAQSSNLVG